MRYTILLFSVFLFLFTNSVYSFLPSESGSSNFIKKEEVTKNNSKKNSEEVTKITKQNKKQLKKIVRKAIFSTYKPKLVKKKRENPPSLDNSKKASTLSKISLVAGISSIVFTGIIYVSLGLLLVGIITGIIGLATRDKEKHDIRKTTLFSLVSIVLGILVIVSLLYFVLTFSLW